MGLKQNTWKLNQWYDQDVAGNVDYSSTVLSLYGWGQNDNGQLGLNNTTGQPSVAQVGANTTWSKIGAGSEQSQASIKNDGTLWTWGMNQYGNLAQNNRTNYSSPKQVPGTTWNEVAKQQQATYATKTDGTLWTWGTNGNDGNLGQNNLVSYSSPVQIGSDTTWNKPIDSYSEVAMAIKTDGTLWAWGSSEGGQFGIPSLGELKRSSPVQVPGTTWALASIGKTVVLAVKTDGTLWSWGDGGKGGLAQNNETDYSSPTQIPGTTWATGTRSLSSSDEFAAATKTDGTLWIWGENDNGQLGLNGANTARKSSPTQIPGTTWRSVFCGRRSMYATKTDGTLWSWGYSNRGGIGLLGQGNTTLYSSPVQIGSDTDWSADVGGSEMSTFGMRVS